MTDRTKLLRRVAAIIYGHGRFAPEEVWKELHPSQKDACKRVADFIEGATERGRA